MVVYRDCRRSIISSSFSPSCSCSCSGCFADWENLLSSSRCPLSWKHKLYGTRMVLVVKDMDLKILRTMIKMLLMMSLILMMSMVMLVTLHSLSSCLSQESVSPPLKMDLSNIISHQHHIHHHHHYNVINHHKWQPEFQKKHRRICF